MELLANLLIRPTRTEYDPQGDLESPKMAQDRITPLQAERHDFSIVNGRNMKLLGSIYLPPIAPGNKIPAVIYSHGSSSNRSEAVRCSSTICSRNLALVCFDFAGCGLSEGTYITCGYYESIDLAAVIEYVLANYPISCVGLWGRSMGAVASLLYASDCSKDLGAICCDSPFDDLNSLCKSFIQKFDIVTEMIGELLYSSVVAKIKEIADFDINDVAPVRIADKIDLPAIFIHGLSDALISIERSRNILQNYQGEWALYELEQGHNDSRPDWVYTVVGDFFHEKLYAKETKELTKQICEEYFGLLKEENPLKDGAPLWQRSGKRGKMLLIPNKITPNMEEIPEVSQESFSSLKSLSEEMETKMIRFLNRHDSLESLVRDDEVMKKSITMMSQSMASPKKDKVLSPTFVRRTKRLPGVTSRKTSMEDASELLPVTVVEK